MKILLAILLFVLSACAETQPPLPVAPEKFYYWKGDGPEPSSQRRERDSYDCLMQAAQTARLGTPIWSMVADLCLRSRGWNLQEKTAQATPQAQWLKLGENDNAATYIDRSSIRRTENLVKMLDLTDYHTIKDIGGDSVFSYRTQREYDCAKEQIRSLWIEAFAGQMGSGPVGTADSVPSEWLPVMPGSVGQTGWKYACGKK